MVGAVVAALVVALVAVLVCFGRFTLVAFWKDFLAESVSRKAGKGKGRGRGHLCAGAMLIFSVSFHFCWIPFGDHPIKLERYRED